jgi:hypothetical protein
MTNSKAIEALRISMPQATLDPASAANILLDSAYWGGIDGVGTSGPPYAGAIICFLALIGFAFLRQQAQMVDTRCDRSSPLLMSWGKYLLRI